MRRVAVAVAAVLVPVAFGAVGVARAVDGIYPEPEGVPAPVAPRVRSWDPDLPTVAILLGAEGANVADSLGPFEVFASSGVFNVVTVAPTADPVTLTGGLDLVPDLTLTELDARLSGPPDVVVVPQVHGATGPLVEWLGEQERRGVPLVMGVCVGAEVLADAGLLDDRPATSHWLKLIGLRRSHPAVEWTEGVRFVDDGDVLTTGGVLSGIDGALRVVERLAGAAAAERVRHDLGWTGYSPGASTAIPAEHPGPGDLVALLSAAYRWDRPTTGVLLTEGVGEIELAAAFRPTTELSYLAHLRSVSSDGSAVTSRHGLTFLARSAWHTALPDLDHVVVPTASPGPVAAQLLADAPAPVTALHETGEFPFDGALRDIARRYDAATAEWVAKSLQYPLPTSVAGPSWPWRLALVPLLLVVVVVAAGVTLRKGVATAGAAAGRPASSSLPFDAERR